MQRKTAITIGAIFIALVAIISGFRFYQLSGSQKYNVVVKPIITRLANNDWRLESVDSFMNDNLKAVARQEPEKVTAFRNKMRSYGRYVGFEGVVKVKEHFKLKNEIGSVNRTVVVARLKFSKGFRRVAISLVKQGGRWTMEGILPLKH